MRRLLLCIDNHFVRTPDGRIWNNGIVGPLFWEKYLQYFAKVAVICRVAEGSYADVHDLSEASHPDVTFYAVPMFQDIRSLLRKRGEIRTVIREAISQGNYDLLVIRIPSILGFYVYHETRNLACKTAVEVVSDLSQRSPSLGWKEALKFRMLHYFTKRLCARADGVSYVTRYALEKVYPAHPDAVRAYYSSIDLTDDYYHVRTIGQPDEQPEIFRLLHVSTLNDHAKGHKALFKIAANLLAAGFLVEVYVVGDGKLRSYYENYAAEQGYASFVTFTGNIANKAELRQLYINSDLLIFPTEHEGLPRVLIEGLATGLPAISTNVGGIPELLSSSEIFSYQDVDGMTGRAAELLSDPALRQEVSDRGYAKAREYRYSELQKKRYRFFADLLEADAGEEAEAGEETGTGEEADAGEETDAGE